MQVKLSSAQARVVACLVEKSITTPQYYPMTVNAIMAAANQKSCRNPLMKLTETEIARIAEAMIAAGIARDGAQGLEAPALAAE